MRPRDDASQRVLQHQLLIFPTPQGQSTCLDTAGNVVVHAWFEGTTTELRVSSMFEAETLRANPFDFLLPVAARLTLPITYENAALLAPYLKTAEKVEGFATEVAEESGGQLMPFLDQLTDRLFNTCRHINRPEGAPQPAAETLARKEGSCRDLAVVFCAACRSQGIAARFVSGYERESAFQEQSQMHAWAEVYVPGGGWRGYDPSRGLAVGLAHIAVAAAADAADAAPITGSFRGSARASMSFSISMQAGETA
jgi:transglutaminase-like putative cysteine protease